MSLTESFINRKTSEISPTEFFELLLEELKLNPGLKGYYRFFKNDSGFLFRKAYFVQRLQFIADHINDKSFNIWDCGSGYGTTGLFLSLNGYSSFGSTVEYYLKEFGNRLDYWKKFGDVSKYSTRLENIFDSHPEESSVDVILLQDTLHHLEPLQKAILIFAKVLKPGGKIILVEENGSNIIQNLKLLIKRGNNRIIEYYDEELQKKVLMGNENIRGYKSWEKEFATHNFIIKHDETQYIRLFPPFFFSEGNYGKLLNMEQDIWKKNAFLRKFFFFGINCIIEKQR